MDDFNNNEQNQKVDLTKHTSDNKVDLTKHIPESNAEDVSFFHNNDDSGRSGSSTAQQPNLQHLQHIESTNQQNMNYNPNQNYQEVNGLAIASLVCGILSIICCCSRIISILLGGVAIGLAIASKKQNENMSGLAVAGIITGAIGGFFGVVLLFLAGMMSFLDIEDTIRDAFDVCMRIKF
ncbi:MAG: DUF4190 domain-containing protein [Ruminococcus sp.]|nr:DUF4190 domain-containing protein [Ruminococcus sp.]